MLADATNVVLAVAAAVAGPLGGLIGVLVSAHRQRRTDDVSTVIDGFKELYGLEKARAVEMAAYIEVSREAGRNLVHEMRNVSTVISLTLRELEATAAREVDLAALLETLRRVKGRIDVAVDTLSGLIPKN